jgi:hypothetical protein
MGDFDRKMVFFDEKNGCFEGVFDGKMGVFYGKMGVFGEFLM